MSKVKLALEIIILDAILIGLALFTSSILTTVNEPPNPNGGGTLWAYSSQSSIVFANHTAVVISHEVQVPWPLQATIGLWFMFAGIMLFLDLLIAYAKPIGKTFDGLFNHRITRFVKHPYTEEEIALVTKGFEIDLRKQSEALKLEGKEEKNAS